MPIKLPIIMGILGSNMVDVQNLLAEAIAIPAGILTVIVATSSNGRMDLPLTENDLSPLKICRLLDHQPHLLKT